MVGVDGESIGIRPWFVMFVSVATAAVTGAVRFRVMGAAPNLLLDITFLAACACVVVCALWLLSKRMTLIAHEEADRAQSQDRR
jgi:high-affinity Fe2+/Pb2+ permease